MYAAVSSLRESGLVTRNKDQSVPLGLARFSNYRRQEKEQTPQSDCWSCISAYYKNKKIRSILGTEKHIAQMLITRDSF